MKSIFGKSASILFLGLALTFASGAEAKNCKAGKACGDTCIAKTATCSSDGAAPMKNCKTGKACGNACIAKDATCTK